MGYLASGLTDELIQELSAVPALHVISRNGVLPFRDRAVGLDSIAAALHVGTIVTGSVQTSGDRVRVEAELIDAKSGNHVGSRTIERPMSDLFALEDGVSQQVATLLRTRVGQQLRVQQIREGTSSVQAQQLLLRAADARDAAATIATDSRAGSAQDGVQLLDRGDSLLAQAEDRGSRLGAAGDRARLANVERRAVVAGAQRSRTTHARALLRRRRGAPRAAQRRSARATRHGFLGDGKDWNERRRCSLHRFRRA